jgi:hypothetical protein
MSAEGKTHLGFSICGGITKCGLIGIPSEDYVSGAIRDIDCPACLEASSVRAVPSTMAEETLHPPKRCEVCGWPLAATIEGGCTEGNCSMRPRPSPTYAEKMAAPSLRARIHDAAFAALPKGSRASARDIRHVADGIADALGAPKQ